MQLLWYFYEHVRHVFAVMPYKHLHRANIQKSRLKK